ncbi:MAG: hypothetical protein ACR2K0_01290, partial [Acidimicrobiales bacterium]
MAVTPSSLLSRFSIRIAHDAHVMPPITSSTCPSSAGAGGVVVFGVELMDPPLDMLLGLAGRKTSV